VSTTLSRDGENATRLYEGLRASILRGELAPGEVTSQVALADSLGVSKTPLREALRMLQRDGLVTFEPNRQPRVATFTAADVEELYVLRILLEAGAARLTVPVMPAEALARMKGLMSEMARYAKARDFEGLDGPHRGFHALVTGGAGERSSDAILDFRDHADRYRRAYVEADPAAWEVSTREHRAILEAAEARDGEAVARLLAAHYARTATTVIDRVDPDHDAAVLRRTQELFGAQTTTDEGDAHG
jgi:DNA-binding GntR family transcriptional regulator